MGNINLMKFVHYSALVLALFLNDASAVRMKCPDDASKLKAVLKALGDQPAPAESGCPCGAAKGGCNKCGGGSADSAAKKAAAKATKAVKKMEEKVIEKAE